MKILIRSLSTNLFFTLEEESFHTINEIMAAIQENKGISRDLYFLCYNHKPLISSNTLDMYGISDQATLDLQFRLRGGMRSSVYAATRENSSIYLKENEKTSFGELETDKNLFNQRFNKVEELQKLYNIEKKIKMQRDLCCWKFEKIHADSISCALFSRDNRLIVSASHDYSIKIFSLETKNEIHHFKHAHQGSVTSVAVTSDGGLVISGSTDRSIKVFDLNTNKLAYDFICLGAINCLVISEDDSLVVSGSEDGSIKIVDLQTKEEVNHFKYAHRGNFVLPSSAYHLIWSKGGVKSLAISADKQLIISTSSDNSIKIFDAHNMVELHQFKNVHEKTIRSVALSKDNSLIISGSDDRSIKVFNIKTKEEVCQFLNAHEDAINSVVLSTENKFIFSGSLDCSIKVFDLETKLQIHHFKHVHQKGILSISLSHDNKFLISCSIDGSMKLFKIQSDAEISHFKNLHRGTIAETFCNHCSEPISSVAISKDSKLLISASLDKSIKVLDLKTQTEIFHFKDIHEGAIRSVTISEDNKFIVSGSEDKTIKIFDLDFKTEVHHFNDLHEGKVLSVSISKNNKLIVSCSEDKSIKILDLEKKQEIFHFKHAHLNRISSAILSNDNKFIVSCSEDASIKIFDIARKIEVFHFKDAHKRGVNSVAISRDDRFIVSGSDDKSIKIFDVRTKSIVHCFEDIHLGSVNKVAISLDGKFFFSCSDDKSIKVFDLQNKVEVHCFKDIHQESISSIAISDDSRYIISASNDCSLKLIAIPHADNDGLSFISSKIPAFSAFPRSESFMFQGVDDISAFIKYQDLYIAPHNWTLLHLLAIFYPHLTKDLNYSEFKIPFLVDSYGKTPLHYLFNYSKIDYQTVNLMFEYIIEYLEAKDPRTYFEYSIVCNSLSNLLESIVMKLNSQLVIRYLKLCVIPATTQFSKCLPDFGMPKKTYAEISKSAILGPNILSKLYQDGNEKITFWICMLNFDYNVKSDDVFHTIYWLTFLKDEEIFKTPAISHFINFLWDQTYTSILIFAIVFSVYMLLLSTYIGIGQRILAFEIVILVMTGFFFMYEVTKMAALGTNYFSKVFNWVDTMQLFFVLALIIPRLLEIEEPTFSHWASALIISFGYERWVSYLRLFNPTRTLIQVTIGIMKDTLGFMLILFIIIIGFSLVFLEFNRDYDYSEHLYGTYKLLYADSDDSEFSLSQKLILSIILFLLNVLLLNLLISIMGDSFDKTQERKAFIDCQTRLDMMQEIIILLRVFRNRNKIERGYLVFCRNYEAGEANENLIGTEWEGRINMMKKMLKNQGYKMEQELQKGVSLVRSEMKLEIDQTKQEIHKVEQKVERLEQIVLQTHEEMMKVMKQLLEKK